MRGFRMTALARRVFREDTFALMVSPAIADLQFEGGGFATVTRGYVAVARAASGALLYDFLADIRILSEDASDLIRIVAMQTCYYAAMLTLIAGTGFMRLSNAELFVIAIGIVGVSVIPVVVCFWPDRYASAADAAE